MVVKTSLLLLPILVPAAASLDDAEVLLQHAAQETATTSGLLSDLLQRFNITSEMLRQSTPEFKNPAGTRAAVATMKDMGELHKERLAEGWKEFAKRASASPDANPEELMQHAKTALMQTGAWQSMKAVAKAASNSSKQLTGKRTRGAVPLDSMIMGFSSSLAPWNNMFKSWGIPLIKAKFELFANFFGPTGDAGRLCIAAKTQLDSDYGSHDHSEFGAITTFAGPAKWDNVPGWKFGSGGGWSNVKIIDVADFNWEWTYAYEPETVGFFFDLDLVDSDGLKEMPTLLQTGSGISKSGQLPSHGSTWFGHTWCSPDWTNYPMVLEEPPRLAMATPAPFVKTIISPDEYDPDAEAV
eukprot:CAMPEP_0197898208 /NCGR_PEP_ID=MMETSP1439-20131203/43479_1 /TAXON_ID=66791 /ORGANISM="Gonyaulax spinifera, Strain CCMP409" /LENGTH=354 /DNA_ID=CAMNT_0043518907 /DNA_START=39 /DNA_END=1103 /DNA_ORIENTATION=+